MSRWSRFSAKLKQPVDNLQDWVMTWRAERARRKKERRWKQKKKQVRAAHAMCVRQLYWQLWDEHLQRVMTARIYDVRIAGIGELRINALHSAGLTSAYDVHRAGVASLCEVSSIGDKLANALVDWARTHIPDRARFGVDPHSLEYIRRLRLLKRKHFGLQSTDFSSPSPDTYYSEQWSYYHSTPPDDTSDDEHTRSDIDYHTVLGVPLGASQEEIHAGYRNRMHEYHPDKVAHLGPELRSLAERKSKLINEAYEALRRR